MVRSKDSLRAGAGRFTLSVGATLLSLVLAEVLGRWLPPGELLAYEYELEDGRILRGPQALTEAFVLPDQLSGPFPSGRLVPSMHFWGHYEPARWDYFDDEGRVEYRTNERGLRGPPIQVPKPSGRKRVLAVGDSFTFGLGVQEEDTWVRRMERRWNERDAEPVEWLNAGITGGFSPATYASWVVEQGLGFEPDLVVVGICLNDLGPLPMVVLPPRAEPWLGGRFDLANRAQRWWQGRDPWEPTPGFDYARVVEQRPQPWEATKAGLRLLGARLARAGVPWVVVVFPMLTFLDARYPFRECHELVRAFCAAESVECLDLLPYFEGEDAAQLWVHPLDQHPNDRAHEMIAAAIDALYAPPWTRSVEPR